MKLKLVIALALVACPASAQHISADGQEVDREFADLGAQTIRSVGFDLCLPATSDEYLALGKQAVLMLTARTAIASELPLKSVYVEAQGLRIPLERVARGELRQVDESGFVEQVSFYLVPIYLTKQEGRLSVDFQGERKSFGVTSFAADGAYYSVDAPGFVRLDEYDDPSEAAPDALRIPGEFRGHENSGDTIPIRVPRCELRGPLRPHFLRASARNNSTSPSPTPSPSLKGGEQHVAPSRHSANAPPSSTTGMSK